MGKEIVGHPLIKWYTESSSWVISWYGGKSQNSSWSEKNLFVKQSSMIPICIWS